MKKIILIAAALLYFGTGSNRSQAQVSMSLNINIGTQPLWGPVGYDYVEFYYLPDIEVYYWVPRRQFVYFYGGRWVFASTLPARYRHYDLYAGYKVVINEPRAYLHFRQHKVKYLPYKGQSWKQVVIKNSDDPKYYVVKGHPHYKGHPGNPGKGNHAGKGNKKAKH